MVNPYVSVDCVLLGFDGEQLNVLLVRQTGEDGKDNTGAHKLPGSLINMDEDLDDAAKRVLKQLTGLSQVKMTQFRAFGGAKRLADAGDAIWLQRFHKLDKQIERIVTIAYLSLLRVDRRMERLQGGYEAQWVPIGKLPRLAFDHEEIVRTAVKEVERLARLTPTILFDLLPRKFTAAQLRLVMENVAGAKPDVKNFHKKLAQMPYVVPLDEKEEGVNHRAARYYKFKNVKPSKMK
jgi:ADP-ribose pyrophosphatase YjhB (NUDIX family)